MGDAGVEGGTLAVPETLLEGDLVFLRGNDRGELAVGGGDSLELCSERGRGGTGLGELGLEGKAL